MIFFNSRKGAKAQRRKGANKSLLNTADSQSFVFCVIYIFKLIFFIGKFMFFPSTQIIKKILFICLCMSGVALLQFPRLQEIIKRSENVSTEDLQKDLDVEKLNLGLLKKIPAFGFDNMVANWAYLGFCQFFGDDEARDKTGYRLSPDFFEVILKHDPKFLTAYQSLSVSTSMFAAMPEKSIELTEKGLKKLSPYTPEKSYFIWRYKGIDELLFLGDNKAAKNSFSTAADWASKYTDEESKRVADISRSTVSFLKKNPNSKYAQIATWSLVLNSKVDKKTRERAIKAIEALGARIEQTPQGNKIIMPPKD
jgi:hypothetical protein